MVGVNQYRVAFVIVCFSVLLVYASVVCSGFEKCASFRCLGGVCAELVPTWKPRKLKVLAIG
jgi:hypothetical protein